MRLEELKPNAAIKGILPDQTITVVSTTWFGSEALELTYKGPSGRVANELLYRHDEPRLELAEHGRPWSFDGDGKSFRLVSEANRIRLAHLFDPVLAVHTSLVDPLPHQITAVYEAMLPRQPLRFLLADDPGAGKTIMAGLLIKELIVRGDLRRCLVVCPGSLAEQWQDELGRRFHLPFDILTNDKLEAARTGNWFLENNLVIARLDKLARDEDAQLKLQAPECQWDLVICDEAHKLSATFFGGEAKFTKRYRLGQLLSGLTRNFLLMTATPHNGKEEDFQLFLALLDGDRFEGRFRDGVHQVDISDLMRRMVKESLRKFDGRPLFPKRFAHTIPYKLSDDEARLYREVTDYVRDEFNRAEALANDKQAGTVGFALTILQRRLASSPEAIYQSLRRRSQRLEKRLREYQLMQRAEPNAALTVANHLLDSEDISDLEDAPDAEVENTEEEFLDQATASRTIDELNAEIATLTRLEGLANQVRRSGEDRKWRELADLLNQIFSAGQTGDSPGEIGEKEVFKSSPQQKLVIFTEHRDPHSYALAITRDTAHRYTLPSKSLLEEEASQYRSELVEQKADLPLAQQLFDGLLGAIPEFKEKQAVIVIPDGKLHLLPFSALADSGQYVLTSHLVTVAPSGTVLDMLRHRASLTPRENLPYLGVAAWTSERPSTTLIADIRRAVSGPERHDFVALPESRSEVETIASDFPKPRTVLLGNHATETNFKRLPLSQFSVIHLALHGYPRFARIPPSTKALWPLAVKFAPAMLTKKPIVLQTEGLGKKPFHERIVLLVNRHTASAAEMIVAFARENKLATIIGEMTAGRLLSATSVKIGNGFRLALPTGAYYTWKGTVLEGTPIEPDELVEFGWRGRREAGDSQLERAAEFALGGQTERAG